jgi:enoyl-CoA hydratase
VQIGLTVPWFAIELARQRLNPAHFDRTVVSGVLYAPDEAAAAGFFDRVVEPGGIESAAREAAAELAGLNREAHAATKLRARAEAIDLVRSAIETELEAVGAT